MKLVCTEERSRGQITISEILKKIETEADNLGYVISGIEGFSIAATFLGEQVKDDTIQSMHVFASYLNELQDRLYRLIAKAKEEEK